MMGIAGLGSGSGGGRGFGGGGGVTLDPLVRRVALLETRLPVVVADDPLSSVVLGTGKMLSDIELLKRVRWDNSLMAGS